MIKLTFPASVRLNNRKIIQEVFISGTYLSLGLISIKYLVSNNSKSRFMINVKKKVGSSPFRNYIKRLLKESLRKQRNNLKFHFDICIMISKKPKIKLKYHYVFNVVKNMINKLNNSNDVSTNKCL